MKQLRWLVIKAKELLMYWLVVGSIFAIVVGIAAFIVVITGQTDEVAALLVEAYNAQHSGKILLIGLNAGLWIGGISFLVSDLGRSLQ